MENGPINTLNSLISVGLTVEEAYKFKQFCKYYNQISYLLEAQVFERVQPGEVVLHLSPKGEIGRIELHPIIVILNNQQLQDSAGNV